MPVFEYTCNACKLKRFSALVGVVSTATPPQCPRCKSQDITKLVSRFARLRSEDESVDALVDAAEGTDMNDPKALRRLAREMTSELGDDGDSLDDFDRFMEEGAGDAPESGSDYGFGSEAPSGA
jgi:putative FmdB family regulatory protein